MTVEYHRAQGVLEYKRAPIITKSIKSFQPKDMRGHSILEPAQCKMRGKR